MAPNGFDIHPDTLNYMAQNQAPTPTTDPAAYGISQVNVPEDHLTSLLELLGSPLSETNRVQLDEVAGHLPGFGPCRTWDAFCARCYRAWTLREKCLTAEDKGSLDHLAWLMAHPDLARAAGFYWKNGWRRPELDEITDIPTPSEAAQEAWRFTAAFNARKELREKVHRLETRALYGVGVLSAAVLRGSKLLYKAADRLAAIRPRTRGR